MAKKSTTLPFLLASIVAVSAAPMQTVLAQPAPPSAAEIVAQTDKVRSPQGAYRVTVGLVEYVNGKARDRVDLAVHAKLYPDSHRFKNLVRYLAPPRDVGKLVL